MIRPSYNDLMQVVNSGKEEGEAPLVSSRYSIVLATAKRARQLIDGAEPMVKPKVNRPLSIAVQEVYEGMVKILPEKAKSVEEAEYELEEALVLEEGEAVAEEAEAVEE